MNPALDAAEATMHERHGYPTATGGCAVCRDDSTAVVRAYLDALDPEDVHSPDLDSGYLMNDDIAKVIKAVRP